MLFVLLGIALLYVGGEFLVRGGTHVARRLGVPPLAIGLTVVAFGTSLPELAVSLDAALQGDDAIAVGNVVGSNIGNILLILGLCALSRPLHVHARLRRVDMPAMVGVSVVLLAMLGTGGGLGRAESALLVLGLLVWLAMTFRADGDEVDADAGDPDAPTPALWPSLWLLAGGLVALVLGARWLVAGATGIARAAGVSEAVVALTVVAIGTSLPELSTSLVATIRGRADLAVGNVVGSNVFNVMGILGITGLVHPLTLGGVGPVDLAVLLASALLLVFVGRRGTVGRGAGLLMCAGYGAYLAWLF
ncbi:MAG: calcium/sodium antiporter [Longimicrobiales bacterium]